MRLQKCGKFSRTYHEFFFYICWTMEINAFIRGACSYLLPSFAASQLKYPTSSSLLYVFLLRFESYAVNAIDKFAAMFNAIKKGTTSAISVCLHWT